MSAIRTTSSNLNFVRVYIHQPSMDVGNIDTAKSDNSVPNTEQKRRKHSASLGIATLSTTLTYGAYPLLPLM